MKSEKSKQIRFWLIFLAILLVSGVFLALVGEKGFTKPSNKPEASILKTDQAPDTSQLSLIKGLSDSREWSSSAKAYVNRYVKPESGYYPPAGQAIAENIRQLQQQPKPNSQFKSLIISSSPKIPQDYNLEVSLDRKTKDFSCPLEEQFFGPILLDDHNLIFQLSTRSGWFSHPKVTEAYSLRANQLKKGQLEPIRLRVLDDFRDRVTQLTGEAYIPLNLKVVPFNPESNSGENGDPRTPRRLEAVTDTVKSGSKALIEETVSFDDMNASDHLVIQSPKRHLTILIIGDVDLKKYVRCTRGEVGAVGAYADQLPLFAATANNWESLRLHIGTFDKGQKLHYQIMALSGDEPTTKPLFLWFVGYHLLNLKFHGEPLSRQSADDTARWLMRVLDVTFSAQEVESVQDPEIKALLAHFLTTPK